MSESDSRPAATRGRSSVRGGRGGFGRGGPRGGHRQSNGPSKEQDDLSAEEPGEIGELKKQYSSQIPILRDMFPDWTDVDLVFALQETGGDLQTTIEKITEGHISQFSEIKKPKDRARSKAKETQVVEQPVATRGGRGRGGLEGSRGARGRGDRARGVSRGGRGGASVPVAKDQNDGVLSGIPETTTTGQPGANGVKPAGESKAQWDQIVTAEAVPKTASEGAKPSLLPEGGAKKTWASMFSQPKPAPAPAVPKQAAAGSEAPSVVVAPPQETSTQSQAERASGILQAAAPSDPLTENNLEHLPDTSIPPATQTAASTVGSDLPGKATPLGSVSQTPIGRPAIGGYAQAAMRATGLTPRSASYQRRVLEQQEAVVLPGHNNVDRAAVQFGSMGLNGDAADADEDREDAETRAQPPQQSPAQPRASLPPSQISAGGPGQDSYAGQAMQTPKQAPGLPPVTSQQQQPLDSNVSQQSQHQAYNQYGRYGQQDVHAPTQKSYDPFSHQTPSGFEQYSTHAHGQTQQQGQQGGYGGYGSAPSDYSQYYGTEQQRNAYQNYYGGSYGQQQGQTRQDGGNAQQRTGAGLGEGAYGSAQSAQQSQGRYSESQTSGQDTSAPASGQQQPSVPSQQGQQQQQPQQQSQYSSAFPYGHPYYNSPYAQAYQSQFGYSGYGAGYGKQGGMYGQPQGYGMNAPSAYEQHASSPATSSFAQPSALQSRDGALSSGTNDYNRAAQTSSTASGGFGGADYGRSQSGYQGYGAQQPGASEDLKSYADPKGGPSPSLGPRPGSAANSAAQGQSSLPQPQGQQQQQQGGYGGYPGFNQSSQYGSNLGGLGGHQGGQQGGYGGYGGFGQQQQQQGQQQQGQQQSYNQYGRGGWGNSYGGH